MTIFWHHVGDQMSTRDFPRTIGTPRMGLREFGVGEILPYLDTQVGLQDRELKDGLERVGTSKFQIWGTPTGAKTALKKLRSGDWLLLLNTDAPYGFFQYVGRVLMRVPGEQWKLSSYLWKEQRFPIILLLQGRLIHYPWPEFKSDLSYSEGLKGMGRVHTIGKAALMRSKFEDEEGFTNFLSEKI